jgi:phosphoserine phosphatase
MQVAVFLDVDGVLTDKAINLQYAHLLGVQDKLVGLERLYANREITNDEFNRGLIPLFREAGFSREFSEKNFKYMQMRGNTDKLLRASPNTFLVTSGPSYFVDTLRKRRRLPKDRVLCSLYQFDKKGLLQACIRPVNSAMKGSFVQERASKFDVSIGVGDSEQDLEFLSHCDIRVLLGGNRLEYFTVRELQPIIDVIRKFQMGDRPLTRPNDIALAELKRLGLVHLDEKFLSPAMQMAAVYTAIAAFENSVRSYVKHTLRGASGADWWNITVPEGIRKMAESRQEEEKKVAWHSKRGEDLIAFIDFGQLNSIIANNWTHFKSLLNKQQWVHHTFDTMERSRNVIMHSGELPVDDIRRIGMCVSDWMKQTRRDENLHCVPEGTREDFS